MSTQIQVVICHSCSGKGVTYTRTITDYHRGEYDTDKHLCWLCKGSGLLTETTTVTHTPYEQPSKHDIKDNTKE